MQQKVERHIFTGIRRDLDIEKHKPENLYDAYNIRIKPREKDTLLGITNERGPLYKDSYSGKYVGHVVIDNRYIVLFLTSACAIKKEENSTITYTSTNRNANTGETKISDKDVILKIDTFDYTYKFLFIGNLNLNTDNPIQGIYRYESSKIEKIYWVDGLNQPRVINIAREWDSIEDDSTISTRFDFIQTLALNESVDVKRVLGGTFAPGVIQYAFSYFYLNGQESNIFYATDLQYIGNKNTKTVDPEGKANDAFEITINNIESKFDYIRIYSIHRTSIDAVPECKIVADINIKGKTSINYVDYGNSGDAITPLEILYVGGQVIIPNSIAFKDSTLFLANYKTDLNILEGPTNASITFNTVNIDPDYGDENHQYDVPKFKVGEHYLFGYQTQDKYGRWSNPIQITNNAIVAASFGQLCEGVCTLSNLPANAVKVRGLCIYPTVEQRNIIATGVINPTVYQRENTLYHHNMYQSSWFFRPECVGSSSIGYQYEHNTSIFKMVNGTDHGFDDSPVSGNLVEIEGGGYDDNNTNFIISYDLVDFYSPDAEFDHLYESFNSSFGVKYIGDVFVDGVSPNDTVNIQQLALSATSDHNTGAQKINRYVGYKSNYFTHTYEDDNTILNNFLNIYPWTSSGSFTTGKSNSNYMDDNLNLPFNSLKSNKLLRWINGNTVFCNPVNLAKCTYKSYLEENGNNSLEFNGNYYTGQVDTVLQTSEISKYATNSLSSITWYPKFEEKRVVEMKYKTCSHLVLSLDNPLYFTNIVSLPDEPNPDPDPDPDNPDPDNPNPNFSNIVKIKGAYYDSTTYDPNKMIWHIKSRLQSLYVDFAVNGAFSVNDLYDVDGTSISRGFFLLGVTNIGEAYMFVVSFVTRQSSQGTFISDVVINFVYGSDYTSKYVWGGQQNLVWEFYDSNGNKHFVIPNWSTNSSINGILDYAGQYVLINGKLIKYEDYINQNRDGNTNDIGSEWHQIPAASQTCYDLNGNDITKRLIMVDLVNNNPVKLQNDVPWFVASTKSVKVNNDRTAVIKFDIGDTWLQDYYCLKTYPFTREDENSITEILKFKCPTRTNLNGRYSTTIAPPPIPEVNNTTFNKVNAVYSNKNNFFNYSKIRETETIVNDIVNAVTWTQENIPNSDVDLNVAISLANSYTFDEKITALINSRMNFYAFHPSSISKISFNPRVEVSPSDGVPIELSTSKKMYGSDKIINNTGATNKNSIIVTNDGVFFIDSNRRELFLLGNDGAFTNISDTRNLNSWFNAQEWLEDSRLFYDEINSDLYIVGENDCLLFNTGLQEFVSFMSYEGVPTMFNAGFNFYAFDWYYNRVGLDDNYTSLYHMFNGNYNEFFGVYKPVYLSFISNPEYNADKIFTTLETRFDLYHGTTLIADRFFDYIQACNEYQDSGEVPITTDPYDYNKASTRAIKKFRIWNVEIPRDSDKTNRIRNTWSTFKLGFNTPTQRHNTVANLAGTTNPNIAKYYNDVMGHGINRENMEEAVMSDIVFRSGINQYGNMNILLHDINVKYFI